MPPLAPALVRPAAGSWACWFQTRQGEKWPVPLADVVNDAGQGTVFQLRKTLPEGTTIEEDRLWSHTDPAWAATVEAAFHEVQALATAREWTKLRGRCEELADARPDPESARKAVEAAARVYLETGAVDGASSRSLDDFVERADGLATLCHWSTPHR